MSLSSSLCIKILSLAVVVWAVLTSFSLTAQGAGWVPWVVLVLLMLLEAYSAGAQPASWANLTNGFARVFGPAMLPYYVVLAAILAIGPSQMRHVSPSGGSWISSPSAQQPKFDRAAGNPSLRPAPNSAPAPKKMPGI